MLSPFVRDLKIEGTRDRQRDIKYIRGRDIDGLENG